MPPSPVRVRRVSFSDHSQTSSTENLSVTTLPRWTAASLENLSPFLFSSNPDISISVTVDGEEEDEEEEGGEGDDGGTKEGGNVASGSSAAQRRSRCVRQASLQVTQPLSHPQSPMCCSSGTHPVISTLNFWLCNLFKSVQGNL